MPAIKPIKIEHDSADAIEAALKSSNGKASQHAFTAAYEISDLAYHAEEQLKALGIPERERLGAVLTALSGVRLPSAYKYTPLRTRVSLLRRGPGWYLTDITTGGHGGPFRRLILTPAQDARAVEVLRRGYTVAVDQAAAEAAWRAEADRIGAELEAAEAARAAGRVAPTEDGGANLSGREG